MQKSDYPLILQAKHIREILGISKSGVYELMRLKDFPLLEVNGRKLVYRDSFFNWLGSKEKRLG